MIAHIKRLILITIEIVFDRHYTWALRDRPWGLVHSRTSICYVVFFLCRLCSLLLPLAFSRRGMYCLSLSGSRLICGPEGCRERVSDSWFLVPGQCSTLKLNSCTRSVLAWISSLSSCAATVGSDFRFSRWKVCLPSNVDTFSWPILQLGIPTSCCGTSGLLHLLER